MQGVSKIVLNDSYKASEEIMKNWSKSFYKAFSSLTEERFKGVCGLYAYCRYVDDLVDNDLNNKSEKEINTELENLEKAVKYIYNKDENFDYEKYIQKFSWWFAFEDTIKKFKVSEISLLNQLKGQRMDLKFRDLKTVEELIEYSKFVAGSVGRMLIPILIHEENYHEDPEVIRACESLGIGMQITNILRDVGEDLRERDRLYLPEELLEKHSVSREKLKELSNSKESHNVVVRNIPKNFIKLWEELSDLADNFYKAYKDFIGYFHLKSRLSLVAASYIYHSIGDEVRKNEYNCFTKKAYTSEEKKIKLGLKALEDLKGYEK